jgi:hypothetical protein
LHHVELWVPDLTRARQQWGWLLGELGYEQFQDWEHGRSWRLGGTYLVVEQSPALTAAGLRRLPGQHRWFRSRTRRRSVLWLGLIRDESALFLVKSSAAPAASIYRCDETIIVTCCNIWLLSGG